MFKLRKTKPVLFSVQHKYICIELQRSKNQGRKIHKEIKHSIFRQYQLKIALN
jgi:hypothetical protein